ncbi:hypothetical protein YK48G_11040 [Lentilactobacillus fungorum]|uniref:D-alanyl-D-alanine carboxypeptidase n=1 Tax=Lentilactobacillus fungorum TaxID=2201250 RepID=A0ABQ3VZA8_9LACO|nr:hypothetical protein [Lentilactobacillus fungorum]GHP13679.1 hypothetical protein YK48G_11040 [Lentilactobacillus fungorum]
MKNPTVKLLVTSLISLGAIFTSQLSLGAASSNDVKLIWRHAMGRHAYTATTGARYSEHLGTRYGFNTQTAKVTWYTTAHEKLYFKDSHTYAIYYHVTNADQSLQGWIWNGYLKPATTSGTATNSSNGGTTTNNGNSSTTAPTTSPSNSTDSSSYSDNAQKFNQADNVKFAQQILQLSPKMVVDNKLTDLAKYDFWVDDHYHYNNPQIKLTNYLTQLYGGQPQGLLKDWGYVSKPDTSLVKAQQSINLNPIDYANLSKYDGDHIGVATEAWSSLPDGKIEKINYVIYVLPPNPTITPSNNTSN